ncbi:unnamed protein product [Peronospora effusa]|nr:unnamed protein product [Peronospora effusa]
MVRVPGSSGDAVFTTSTSSPSLPKSATRQPTGTQGEKKVHTRHRGTPSNSRQSSTVSGLGSHHTILRCHSTTNWTEEGLEEAYHRNKLKTFVRKDPVMKTLKVKLLYQVHGPITSLPTASTDLEVF